jgi:hypothetical protein
LFQSSLPGIFANALDHDDFGLNQSKIIVIEVINLEHVVIGKVVQLCRNML